MTFDDSITREDFVELLNTLYNIDGHLDTLAKETWSIDSIARDLFIRTVTRGSTTVDLKSVATWSYEAAKILWDEAVAQESKPWEPKP